MAYWKQRKLLIISFFIFLILAIPTFAENSVSTGVGVNFFRYNTTYLTALSAAYHHQLSEGLELNIGGDFNIATRKDDDGEVKPRFVIPANVGLNFTFPQEKMIFLFGTGLTPTFNINNDLDGGDRFRFYMGPYLKGAVRVKVHPIMRWYLEYQQDLLIGGKNWINSSSRVVTGINFSLVRDES